MARSLIYYKYMTKEKMPYKIIQEMVNERQTLPDDMIIAELASLTVLPDEDDPIWNDDEIWSERLYPYLASAEIASTRKLKSTVLLLLERACYGDPGETMRGLSTYIEAIADGDWEWLTEQCIEAAKSPHPGSRLWAVSELRKLDNPRSLPTLIEAFYDNAQLVREEAFFAIRRLCRNYEGADAERVRNLAKTALNTYLSEEHAVKDLEMARETLDEIGN